MEYETLHDEADDWCDVPPLGWRCTRAKGHEGPCAAVECPEDIDFVAKGMERLRETPNPTRSQRMRDSGFTRRPTAKSLPSDE